MSKLTYKEISKIVDQYISSANEIHGYAYVAGSLGSMFATAIAGSSVARQKEILSDVASMQRIMDERAKKVA